MTDLLSKLDFMVAGRGDRPQCHLDKVPGMEPIAAHRWQWNVDTYVANVSLEAGAAIRISLDVVDRPSDTAALEANHKLPGNLRYAMRGCRCLLVADTQFDGAAHLPRSFDELQAGLRSAVGRDVPADSHEPLTTDEVGAAIAACHWPDGIVVQLDDGWELRPRLRGDATPVQAVIDGSGLRVHRPVVTGLGNAVGREAVCAQALRFNGQLRHARLAASDGVLMAESRLHGGQLTRPWLETAAWAVAVACRHTEAMLRILAENEEVADFYAAMFLSVEQ